MLSNTSIERVHVSARIQESSLFLFESFLSVFAETGKCWGSLTMLDRYSIRLTGTWWVSVSQVVSKHRLPRCDLRYSG